MNKNIKNHKKIQDNSKSNLNIDNNNLKNKNIKFRKISSKSNLNNSSKTSLKKTIKIKKKRDINKRKLSSNFCDIISIIKKYKDLKRNPYFVYIIECEGDKLYTGITIDVNRRFNEHLDRSDNRKGAKFTKLYKPIRLKAYFKLKNRSIATSVEHKIKKLVKDEKLMLCKYGENK